LSLYPVQESKSDARLEEFLQAGRAYFSSSVEVGRAASQLSTRPDREKKSLEKWLEWQVGEGRGGQGRNPKSTGREHRDIEGWDEAGGIKEGIQAGWDQRRRAKGGSFPDESG
jgi:hypothetical protein